MGLLSCVFGDFFFVLERISGAPHIVKSADRENDPEKIHGGESDRASKSAHAAKFQENGH